MAIAGQRPSNIAGSISSIFHLPHLAWSRNILQFRDGQSNTMFYEEEKAANPTKKSLDAKKRRLQYKQKLEEEKEAKTGFK